MGRRKGWLELVISSHLLHPLNKILQSYFHVFAIITCFPLAFFPLWSLSARSRCELTQQTDKGEVNQYKTHQNPSLTQTTWRVIHIFLPPFLIFISLITAYTLANKETFWNQSFRIRNNISYNWKDLSYSRFYIH